MAETVETAIYRLSYQAGDSAQQVGAVRSAIDALNKSTEIQVTQEEKVERATRTTTQSFERYLARHDERFRAERRLREELERIQRFQEEGIGTAAQHASIIGSVTARYNEQIGSAQGLTGATAALERATYRATSRLGVFGDVLRAVGPIGIAAGVAIAGVSFGLAKATKEAEEALTANLRFAAQLRATASASGQTVEGLNAQIDAIKRNSLAQEESLRSAASQLLLFRNISGSAFREALQLSADLAAVGFGSVESAAQALAKAVNEPGEGLRALKAAGVSFNETQIETLKRMAETGHRAEAMRRIFDEVRASVGGAGVAGTATLAGSFDQFGKSISDLWQTIGQALPLETLARGIHAVADAIGRFNERYSLEAKIGRARDEVQRLAEQYYGTDHPAARAALGAQLGPAGDRLAMLEAEQRAINDRARAAERGAAAQAKLNAQESLENLIINAKLEREDEQHAAFERRYKEAVQLAEQQVKAVATAKLEAEQALRLLEAYHQGEATYRQVQEDIAVENALRQQSLDLLSEQGRAYAENVRIAARAQSELKELQEEEKRRQAELKRQEEERARALARPFEQAAERIQASFADMFTNIFETGEFKFKDLASSIKSIFARMLGELVTLAIAQPIIVPIMTQLGGALGLSQSALGQLGANLGGGIAGGGGGGILGLLGLGGAGSLTGNIGGGIFGPGYSLSSSADVPPGYMMTASGPQAVGFLGAAGNMLGGAIAGLGFGQLVGNGSMASNIGGMAGGAIGTMILPGIGTVVGSLLGSLIGGLFKDYDYPYAIGTIGVKGGQAVAKGTNVLDEGPIDEIRNAQNTIVSVLNQFAQAIGGTFESATTTSIGYNVQRPGTALGTGYFAGTGGGFAEGAERMGLSDLQAAANAAVTSFLQRVTIGGIEPATADLIKAMSGVNASIDDITAAATALETALRPIEAELDQWQQAIKALHDQFDPLIARMEDYRLSTEALDTALAAALAAVKDKFEQAALDQLAAVRGSLADQLAVIEKSYAQQVKDANDLGASLEAVNEAYRLTRESAIEAAQSQLEQARAAQEGMAQQILGFFGGLTGPIARLIDSLTYGPQSILSPQAQLDAARAAYETQLGLARGGSIAAIEAFPGAAQQYLGLAQAFYAAGPQYTDIFRSVNQSLMEVLGMVQTAQTENFGDLALTLRDSLQDHADQLKPLLEKSNRLLEKLTDQLAAVA